MGRSWSTGAPSEYEKELLYWNRLPTESVQSPSAEILKNQNIWMQSCAMCWSCLSGEAGTDDNPLLQHFLFCDSLSKGKLHFQFYQTLVLTIDKDQEKFYCSTAYTLCAFPWSLMPPFGAGRRGKCLRIKLIRILFRFKKKWIMSILKTNFLIYLSLFP